MARNRFTDYVTDDQWVAMLDMVNEDAEEGETGWTFNFPTTNDGNCRVVTPDGRRRLIDKDGTVYRAEDLPDDEG